MSKTVKMENVEIVYETESTLLKRIGFKPAEIGMSWKEVLAYTCDLCGRSQEFRRPVYLGLYTGLSKTPLFVPDFTVSEWGHKKTPIVFCDCHKECEIDAKIEELKKLEKGCQPQEARDE